jgi:hypothetical protein
MVQTTSQLVALLTFALGSLTTGYAAPTARASNDCGTNLTLPLLLSVRPYGSTSAANEHPLELFQKSQDIPSAITDYALTVSSFGSFHLSLISAADLRNQYRSAQMIAVPRRRSPLTGY